MDLEVDDFLAHYGVKGMRWGFRKREETAAAASTGVIASMKARNLRINTQNRQTILARIEKSNVRVSEIQKEIAGIDSGKIKAADPYRKSDLALEKSGLQSQVKRDTARTQKEATSGLTPTQKKVLIGAGIVAAAGLTVAVIYNRDEIGAFSRTRLTKVKTGDLFKRNDALKNASTPDEVLSKVVKGANPKYKTMGGMMNCRRATFAYEMRRRGYDVGATTSALGKGQNETGLVNALIKGDRNIKTFQSLSSFVKSDASPSAAIRTRAALKDARQYATQTASMDFKKYNDINKYVSQMKDAFASQPNGARGEIAFNMKQFVHSMQYEIFDGVPHIFDSQKAAHYPLTELGLSELFGKWSAPAGATLTRLDNLDLDLDFIAQWVK